MKCRVFISLTKVKGVPCDAKGIYDVDLSDRMRNRYEACKMFLEQHPEIVLKPIDMYTTSKEGLWEGTVSLKVFKDHRVKWPVVDRVEEV